MYNNNNNIISCYVLHSATMTHYADGGLSCMEVLMVTPGSLCIFTALLIIELLQFWNTL